MSDTVNFSALINLESFIPQVINYLCWKVVPFSRLPEAMFRLIHMYPATESGQSKSGPLLTIVLYNCFQ